VADGRRTAGDRAAAAVHVQPAGPAPGRHGAARGRGVPGDSDVPVVAYQFNPVDGASSFLSDAAMLYPAAALDTVNHVTAWKSMYDNTNLPAQLRDGDRDGGRDDGDGRPERGDGGGPGVPQGAPGAPYQVALQEGDVLNVAVQSIPDSMTGTKITATRTTRSRCSPARSAR
jgi:hypothetical protein